MSDGNGRRLIGTYTTDEAPGAIPNGTRVVKVTYERGDALKIGAKGTVIGSLGPMPPAQARASVPQHAERIDAAVRNEEAWAFVAYFIEWDAMPGVAVGVMGFKIAEDT